MAAAEPGHSVEVDGGTGAISADPRRQARRLWWLLAGVVGLVLLLLFLASGGFFLYAAAVTLGLLMISTGVATGSILGLDLRRGLSATEVELGAVVDVHLVVTNKKQWPAWWLFLEERVGAGLDVEGGRCRLLSLEAGKSDHLRYRLHTTRRGLFRVGPAVVEAGEPFGLVRRYRVDAAPQFLTVLPRRLEMSQGLPLGHRPVHEVPRQRSLLEDPSRFLGVREYRPGDPLRRIHWRAAARTGKLQIKLFEPAVLEGILLAVEMQAGSYGPGIVGADDENPLEELAITAAASLAELVLAGGQGVGLLSNGADAAELYPQDWEGGVFRNLDDLRSSDGGEPPGSDPPHDQSADGWQRGGAQPAAPLPVEVPSARGDWQRERVLHALARLIPTSGLSLPELLYRELPRLSRQVVVLIVTPRIDPHLRLVVTELGRSGFEVGVVWVDTPGSQDSRDLYGAGASAGSSLPAAVAVYRVTDDDDLMALGSRRL